MPRGWQKGQSGNPGGRAKENAEVKALARQNCTDAVLELVKLMKHSKDEKIRLAASNAILDRAVGKPAQAIVGGDEDDAPLRVVTRIELVDLDSDGSGTGTDSTQA